MTWPFGQKKASDKQPSQQEEPEPFRWISVDEAMKLLEDKHVQLIDVREAWEYNSGHIPGARLVPLKTLLRQPRDYLTADNLVFVCAAGQRSTVASEMAAALGFSRVYNVRGGTDAWRAKGYPIEK